MQNKKTIKLRPEEVQNFVNAASKCTFDINVSSLSTSKYTVDAKSIVGVMGLDMSRELLVEYNGVDEHFENVLDGLRAAV
ncbi:MAG: HPr family phosphocarrier protein [Eubacteriales bacterium]|nr:HPr family phosphocarrier protein [Eubacteriales bacterium]